MKIGVIGSVQATKDWFVLGDRNASIKESFRAFIDGLMVYPYSEGDSLTVLIATDKGVCTLIKEWCEDNHTKHEDYDVNKDLGERALSIRNENLVKNSDVVVVYPASGYYNLNIKEIIDLAVDYGKPAMIMPISDNNCLYRDLIKSNGDDYDEWLDEWETIDNIDLNPYILENKSLGDLIKNLEWDTPFKSLKYEKMYLFDHITPEDLVVYIERKYGVKYNRKDKKDYTYER